ncbi:cell division protein FtsN [Mesocricetibacter intestinalis]|uniref:Cell division protein FtsN n=1 Tax=Mesocricetibacter intestinalis TaxID=1521930 RepID=A0A4V3D9P0_9PAST|nr:cell division protein FtsN [Mesocricetibacter intestinalis]TDQ58067.1 cell division protein FtsN [Mesocricetibacter intestinalis]
MVQRDYAVRSNSRKKKKAGGLNKPVLLCIAVILVVCFAAGLYLLKEKAQEGVAVERTTDNKLVPKSQLPSRPEEVWSYIKELESRTVPTDAAQSERNLQLSDKQKEELLRLAERERQQAEEKAKKAEAAANRQEEITVPVESARPAQQSSVSGEELAAAEQRRKEELKRNEQLKAEAAKKAEAVKEVKKTESAKSAKFGLQCGAFKNREQAENLQARLVMTGLNARVNPSADWNRVVIGPIGDRSAASAAQKQAAAITGCVIIGM